MKHFRSEEHIDLKPDDYIGNMKFYKAYPIEGVPDDLRYMNEPRTITDKAQPYSLKRLRDAILKSKVSILMISQHMDITATSISCKLKGTQACSHEGLAEIREVFKSLKA